MKRYRTPTVGSDSQVRRLTRRELLLMTGGGALATVMTACDSSSTDSSGQDNGGLPRKGAEAPGLAQSVAEGSLEPVAERLPQKPLVVQPVTRIGPYGGEWVSGIIGASDTAWIDRTIGYEQLVNWDPEFTTPAPNIAEEYEVNGDATEFTFRLREGMRWSDGEPFSADDIMFWYEDVVRNEELTSSPPAWMVRGGELGVAEKVEDYVVTFRFAEPHGLFLQLLATARTRPICSYPRHYAEQFHHNYNPTVDQLVQEEGQRDWVALFGSKTGVWAYNNKEKPTLLGWKLTSEVGEGSRVAFERNPYYWKVDPEGSQLPYLDRVVYTVVQDAQVLLLQALNGEIDMMSRHFNTPADKPVLSRDSEKGGYGFFTLQPFQMNTTLIMFNLVHPDTTKRQIFQNLDFRIGLSHAIDRRTIIDTVFQRQGEPWQAAPRPDSELYNEKLAKQYTEYDVELANSHLDKAGYDRRNPDGIRLGPDGNPISFSVLVNNFNAKWTDVMELVRNSWLDVGVDAKISAIDRSLWRDRMDANEHDATIWEGACGKEPDLILCPSNYFPFDHNSLFALQWSDWYQSGGEAGEEPPTGPREQMNLYDRLQNAMDEEEQFELMRQILEIASDELYALGISFETAGYGIVKNDFKNVPESMPWGFQFLNPAPTHPEQYYVEE